jgi:hypothetical protein
VTRKTRRVLKIAVVFSMLLLITSCIFLPNYPRILRSGKYDSVQSQDVARPSANPGTPVAETQTEPHTCGLHAMRSMYRAYGLAPEAFNLRFRLGTDEPAMRADKDSTGTLHPDLYRVLAQDGFAIEVLDLDADVASKALQNHLAWQQLALAVVYRSTYHWVLIGPSNRDGELVLYDSLKDEAVAMTIDVFLDSALSITLVEPSAGEPLSASRAHSLGLSEMAKLYQRKE